MAGKIQPCCVKKSIWTLKKRKGIPAPRANFARVYIDSVYWGFYSLVEHVDKVFLKSHYRDDDGNLYKVDKVCWNGKEGNQEDYYEDLELKTNEKENNWSNLINFLGVLNNTLNAEFPLVSTRFLMHSLS